MPEIQKVTDPLKIVTDSVLFSTLERQGIDKDYVEFWHDYALRSKGVEYSPYAKFYRDLKSSKRFMVVSGLPMVDAYGSQHELLWRENRRIIENGNNIFHSIIDKRAVRLITLSDQPSGMKKDAQLTYYPELFLSGVKIKPISDMAIILETDPVNLNYHYNTLEWDYGICKRRLRIIEGRILGYWVFASKPTGEVRIKYNQFGDYKLRLGQFKINSDEEVVKPEDFDLLAALQGGYPVTVSDSQTFYPDASPETNSVDGWCYHEAPTSNGLAWATLHASAGDNASDDGTILSVFLGSGATTNYWRSIYRNPILFYTGALPDNSVISGGVLSLYGQAKVDNLSITPSGCIYSSNPDSNTAVIGTDYAVAKWGTTELANVISYADWKTTDPYWNDFTLNSSGIVLISRTGVSKFGFRNANYDAPNTPPNWSYPTNWWSVIQPYSSDQGVGYKPKLVVTYYVIPRHGFVNFQDPGIV